MVTIMPQGDAAGHVAAHDLTEFIDRYFFARLSL
jgi:hypothetical protein